jgi:hypothetical protein
MASACDTKQKNSPAGRRAGKDYLNVNTLTPERDASKLLSMADNVVVRNRAYRLVRRSDNLEERERQYGRLNKSISELAETAACLRKAGQP